MKYWQRQIWTIQDRTCERGEYSDVVTTFGDLQLQQKCFVADRDVQISAPVSIGRFLTPMNATVKSADVKIYTFVTLHYLKGQITSNFGLFPIHSTIRVH